MNITDPFIFTSPEFNGSYKIVILA